MASNWTDMTPLDFTTDTLPAQQLGLFPVDSQNRVGGDLFADLDAD